MSTETVMSVALADAAATKAVKAVKAVKAKTAKLVGVAGSTNVWGLITNREKAVAQTDNTMATICDTFLAMHVKSDWFKSPSKGKETDKAHAAFYANLKLAIVASFSVETRRIMEADIKVLSEEQKASRRYAQQQIGARVNDYSRAYAKRTEPKAGEAKTPKSDPVFCMEHLIAVSKRAAKSEDEAYVQIKALVDQAMKLIPKN